MEQANFKVYGYRWIVLLAFMFIAAINQFLWITYAPITGSAASHFGVSDLSIGLGIAIGQPLIGSVTL